MTVVFWEGWNTGNGEECGLSISDSDSNSSESGGGGEWYNVRVIDKIKKEIMHHDTG